MLEDNLFLDETFTQPAWPETLFADVEEMRAAAREMLGTDSDDIFYEEGALEETADKLWAKKRSATPAEKAKLQTPADGCSVAYVEGKGFAVHTHRARSKYYQKPEDIPVKVIKFIASTG